LFTLSSAQTEKYLWKKIVKTSDDIVVSTFRL